jgi:methylenetetrahydrofolate dehydrogenase (NADP+)/methenyltetrahydrofolate cyclohydrolase
MLIPSKKIGEVIESRMIEEVKALKAKGIHPRLTTILVGSATEQLSFVSIKEKKSKKLGIGFNFVHLKKEPLYQEFSRSIHTEANKPETTGMIVQLPLPGQLMSDTLFNCIPHIKEIEGHKHKTPFIPPIGLAVLSALKYSLLQSLDYDDVIVTMKDKSFFHKSLKHKKIILIGRGLTGGKPIARTLSMMELPFMNIGSSTTSEAADQFIKEADIVITAVGKKVLTAENIKPGAILLNVGLRHENGKLKGDYDEKEIDDVAGAYTQTPGGIGPIDVLYLFRNLIDAASMA